MSMQLFNTGISYTFKSNQFRMKIEQEIQQEVFKTELNKMIINISYTANWLNLRIAQSLKHYDISPQQFNVLRILRGQKGTPATVNLITERMLDKNSNASRLIDKLKSKELVIRKECPKDRRAVDILITEKGLQLLLEIDKELVNTEKSMKVLSDEEMKTINDLLDKFRTEIQKLESK